MDERDEIEITQEMNSYDPESKDDLNALARILYAAHGYQAPRGFDFTASPHPQERQMFSLACIAQWFFLENGL